MESHVMVTALYFKSVVVLAAPDPGCGVQDLHFQHVNSWLQRS